MQIDIVYNEQLKEYSASIYLYIYLSTYIYIYIYVCIYKLSTFRAKREKNTTATALSQLSDKNTVVMFT